MAGIEKLKFNPFIKGNFDYIKDYDGDLEALQNGLNQGQNTNSETIERIDSIESILSMLQSGQIIPAERQGTIENNNIIYNITYESYVPLKGTKKFFVILDNPLQTGSTSAEELVKLKIQTDKLKHITIAPPTVSDTPSETDLYAGMVGYNAENNLGILVSDGYVYLKQGGYAKTDVFDLKCTYTIDEDGVMYLAKYVEPPPPEEPEEDEEPETDPTVITVPTVPEPQSVIIIISGRNENTVTFAITNGYFQLTNGDSVNFTDQLTITEGEDTWSVLRVMHKDNVDAKLKDILERRVLMRAIIDEKDSKQDSAYIIGGAGMESTPPASFIKANAFVIDSLEEDLILNNENFPSESVIYIVKAKNDFNVNGLANIVFNNKETGFTTDRSFEIWLEKDTGQNDMLLLKNGTVESNALNRGECVRLFFDYETSNWSVVYITPGKDGAPGQDGRGITQVQMNENGDLIISYTNGVEENAGHVGVNNAGVGVCASPNYARHITADVTGVSIAQTWAITQGQATYKQFNLLAGTLTNQDYPNTTPQTSMYDAAAGRLQDSKTGQVNQWSITVAFTAIGSQANYALKLGLRNLSNGEYVEDVKIISTANNFQNGNVTFKLETIGSENSTGAGKGYVIELGTNNAFAYNTVFNVTKIRRVSLAMEIDVPEIEPEHVKINGVKWAKYNVDAPGAFAANPESCGMLYQWNRRMGWSNSGQLINSDGGNTWDSSPQTVPTWESENDPSPNGYRVPTNTELASLLDGNNVLNEVILHNGIQCRKFTDIATNNHIILPISYFRSTGGEHSMGIGFYYWSRTSHTTVADAYYLSAQASGIGNMASISKNYGFLVRPVCK